MKSLQSLFVLSLFSVAQCAMAQFTDEINSNRPGRSMMAFSVGKSIFQAETGINYVSEDHKTHDYKANGLMGEFDVRWGLFFEQLEFIAEIQYQNDTYTSAILEKNRSALKKTLFGAKYLVYDPFKNYEEKPNVYSWKANQKFKWRRLLPAVSAYAGVNFNIGDTYNFPNEPIYGPKIMIITQQQLNPHVVFVTNIFYNDFLSEFKNYGFIATLTYGFNERWSCFVEDKGIQGEYYADNIFSFGAAYLIKQNIQIDVSIGRNFKDTPEIVFGGIGFSWRFDKNYKPVKIEVEDDVKDKDKTKGDKKRDKQKEETKKRLEEDL
jgi:hypothetical protein